MERRTAREEALLSAPAPAAPLAPVTYGDIGMATFGRAGRLFVNVQMHATLLMVATIYHLLAALNVHWLCGLDLPSAALAVAGIVWLHVFLKSLGDLAVLSYLNLGINVTLCGAVIAQTLRHPPATSPQRDIVVPDALSVGGAFASFGFAYGCHPVLPDVLSSMRRPREFGRMIKASFVVALALYVPLVIVAYATYGRGVQSPMYETPEISELPMMRVIKAATVLPMIFTYPLVLTPPEAALERVLGVDERPCPRLRRIGLRSLFVVFTTGVAILVRTREHFGPLVDLVSSCTSTFTAFLMPCVFGLRLRGIGGERGVGRLELCVNIFVIVAASTGAIFGTIQAVEALSALGGKAATR